MASCFWTDARALFSRLNEQDNATALPTTSMGGITFVAGASRAERLAHDPEKWEPVFGKDHAQIKR
jgi:hypothetical protein